MFRAQKPVDLPEASAAEQAYADVTVVIPCLNEAAAIGQVIEGFRQSLPGARICVFDNGSEDATSQEAQRAGANVFREPQRGKGNVIRRMFRDIDSDIYLMVDGDLTYDAAAAPELIKALREHGLDMVIGARKSQGEGAYRPGHRFGNRVLTGLISNLFRAELKDMLSGYRVLSRRLVKSFPVDTSGFEIETELTVHALQLDAPFMEIETDYSERVQGSASKLNTWRDGARILRTVCQLLVLERPLATFGGAGLMALLVSLILFWPIWIDFQSTGIVPRIPTLLVSMALAIIGLISLFSGLILSGITRTRRDMKRLAYLATSPRAKD